jgi:predicted regulator of Ras-like GTPase activity (Roadblock/LC7/MglB family)
VGEPVNGLAAQYSTIPPGQFATPANAGTAIASSGWGQAPVAPEPLDAAQIEAKKNAWAQEAEQLETGTWRAFAPKMNEGLGSTPPPLPSPGPAPAMQPPQAAGGDRWDLPIQERAKSQTDMPVQPSEAAPPVMPIQPVAAQTAAQQRWDVPIQERAKMEAEAPQAAPAMPSMGMPSMGMPPGAVGSPVGASGIPVNQIVEKMGQVLGGTSQAASAEAQESRWDVPIQERMKSQSSQEVPVVPSVAPAPQAPAWGQPASFDAPQPQAPAPVAPAADNSWGTSASSWGQEPAAAPAIASGWDNQPAAAQAAASGWDAQPAAAPAVASGWDAQPAAAPAVASGWDMQPAAAPSNGGWGSGDAIPQPAAQPTSSWGQPAGSSWGEAPAAAAVGQPAQSAAPAGQSSWGNDTAAGGWGQPPAPMANSWATPPAQTPAGAAPPPPPPPPPEPPAIKPEITDKVQGGGLLTGIDDKAIDRIFGEIGVQEPVSKGLVNSGGEPVSNFSPPATPAPEPMAAAAPSPPVPAQAFAQPSSFPQAASAAPEAPKGLLGGIDDNAIDRIFSQNLGVSEPSVPVGRGAEMATAGAVSNNWASAAPAAVPAPQAPAAVEPAGGSGWGAPPAATGWGQPAIGQAPPAEAPAAAGNSGWGMAPTAAPSQWGQPPQAAESGPPKLFSVDDMAMDKIFENNLGIKDGQQAANAPAMSAAAQMPPPAPFAAPLPTAADMPAPEAAYQGGPPPKIEGIGRLDAGGDQNQDAGSGRIASIGKFLLDQKDLDKIGKLTNTDFNDSKLRILTKENSDDLQALLGQIGTQKGVVGSVIVGHDGLLIANTMPSDMDAESVGVWALGVYMNTEHVTKKMGHDRVHQVVSRTPRGYVIIADFGGGLLVTVTEGKDTDSLIPLMRTITQLVN